jgi:hypothetical protein
MINNNESLNTNSVEFSVAEVLDVKQFDTYKHTDANNYSLFSIQARIDGPINKPIVSVKPLNNNIKKIPIIGEIILIFKLRSVLTSNPVYNQEQWYYLSTIDLNSAINHNALIDYTNSDNAKTKNPGKQFKQTTVAPLQPVEGDVLIEGRWSNGIRLGSTVGASDLYTIPPNTEWSGNVGDPITIISNGHKTTADSKFVIESPETTASSIYLTSTQKINKLKLHNPVRISDSVITYNKSQLIASADRIILSSKQDTIILDSKIGIEINSPKIKMGVSDDKEPTLHSEAMLKLLQIIVNTIKIGFKDSAGTICTPINKQLSSKTVTELFKKIQNWDIMVDKYK